MPKNQPFAACVFDIETTALEAVGAGIVLMACVKPMGVKKVRVFRVDRSGDELGHEVNMLTALFRELEKYDLVIGHNVNRFDFPFLKTRAQVLGVPFKHRPMTYDTLEGFKRTGYRTVLNGFGKPSAGLDMVVDMFGKKQRKTKIYPRHHWDAIWGSKADRSVAMADIVDHCIRDVEMNEVIYWHILEADWNPTYKRVK